MFSNKVPHISYKSVTLVTVFGRTLSTNKIHYIYLNGALAAVHFVKVGDTVMAGDGSSDTVESLWMYNVKQGLLNQQEVINMKNITAGYHNCKWFFIFNL